MLLQSFDNTSIIYSNPSHELLKVWAFLNFFVFSLISIKWWFLKPQKKVRSITESTCKIRITWNKKINCAMYKSLQTIRNINIEKRSDKKHSFLGCRILLLENINKIYLIFDQLFNYIETNHFQHVLLCRSNLSNFTKKNTPPNLFSTSAKSIGKTLKYL